MMDELRRCDICDRTEGELYLAAASSDNEAALEMDSDGLWLCRDCRSRSVTTPVGSLESSELPGELAALVGRSAGAISYTLNLPYEPPFMAVIDAANEIAYDQDEYMSAWTFVTQHEDDTTIWCDPAGSAQIAAVTQEDGSIRIESR